VNKLERGDLFLHRLLAGIWALAVLALLAASVGSLATSRYLWALVEFTEAAILGGLWLLLLWPHWRPLEREARAWKKWEKGR
jgi:uncharacterized membrane protein YccC